MNSNAIPKRWDLLSTLATDMMDGYTKCPVALNLNSKTPALIQVDLDAAIAARTAYQKSRSKRGESVGPEYKAAVAATDEFFGKAKKALAAHLGDQWNESWIEAGFVNRSTRLPKTASGREQLIKDLAAYFADHPGYELPTITVTAARAKELQLALTETRSSTKSHKGDQGTLRDARDAAVATLRRRLSSVVTELRVHLADDSPLWKAFGLTAPALLIQRDADKAAARAIQAAERAAKKVAEAAEKAALRAKKVAEKAAEKAAQAAEDADRKSAEAAQKMAALNPGTMTPFRASEPPTPSAPSIRPIAPGNAGETAPASDSEVELNG